MNTALKIQNILKYITPGIVISSIIFIFFGIKIFIDGIYTSTSKEHLIYTTISPIILIITSVLILVMILK